MFYTKVDRMIWKVCPKSCENIRAVEQELVGRTTPTKEYGEQHEKILTTFLLDTPDVWIWTTYLWSMPRTICQIKVIETDGFTVRQRFVIVAVKHFSHLSAVVEIETGNFIWHKFLIF